MRAADRARMFRGFPPLGVLSSSLGLALSIYAIHVEKMARQDEDYEAACDLAEDVSCSKVFTSVYGHIMSHMGVVPHGHPLDQPNAAYGAVFYLVVMVLYLWPLHPKLKGWAILSLTGPSLAMSAYLAFVLFYRLVNFCAICVSTYFLNVAIFIGAVRLIRQAKFRRD